MSEHENISMADATGAQLPPQSIQSEQSVLGGLLLDNTAWDRIGDVIGEGDFYRADHRLIYRHIVGMIENNKPADVLTATESLAAVGKLEEVGGQGYLGSLVLNTPSVANIRRYAEIVRDRSQKRFVLGALMAAQDSIYGNSGATAAEVLEQLQAKLSDDRLTAGKKAREFGSILTEVIDDIDARYQRGGQTITGVETGFIDLDNMTAGLQYGDLIVIAGRPSMGKTAIAMNIVEHVAINLNRAVGVFSLEMSDKQLVQRMMGSVGRMDQHALRTGRLQESDWPKLLKTTERLQQARIFIEDTFDLSPQSIRAKVRRMKRANPDLGLIVVDYLQLMDSDQERRVDGIAEISRGLKRVAKECHVPIVALSQLNRSVEARQDKRPIMADLRESGAIEQDADVILFMYRDEVYNRDTPNPGTAEVIVGKQRNGPTGDVKLSYIGKHTRFENFAGEWHAYKPSTRPRSRGFEDGGRDWHQNY